MAKLAFIQNFKKKVYLIVLTLLSLIWELKTKLKKFLGFMVEHRAKIFTSKSFIT